MKIGILHSIIRKDEKLLLEELRKRKDLEIVMIDDREVSFALDRNTFDVDIVIERCINHSRALHALRILQSYNVRCVNDYGVATICGDKLLTAVSLQEAGVPQPTVRIAFTESSALKSIEEIGYPVVLKPAVGSWGRLISKVNDRDSAESLLEHKKVLGSYHHSIFFIQKYIEKKGRDVRAFVIGDECVAAIYRNSEHWITNTARGGIVTNCPVTNELSKICLDAARAVGGGMVSIDLFETENGLLVNEVNYTMEFKNSIEVTGVNIPAKMVDYVLQEAQK